MAGLHAQFGPEGYEGLTPPASIGSESGWSVVNGSATVSDAESASGNNSVVLGAGLPVSQAERAVQVAEWGSEDVAWWDFWFLPMANTEGDGAWSIDADGSKIAFRAVQVKISEGELVSVPVQDGRNGLSTTATVNTEGTSIRLEGNSWKAIPYSYTITGSTVLTFEIDVTAAGEIIGIYLDDDLQVDTTQLFQIAGSQSGGYIGQYNYSGSGFQSVTIPIGQHYTGSVDYLILLADDDVAGLADATFRNIQLHEGNLPDGEQGMLLVTDADESISLPVYFSTTANASDQWTRLTLRQDYATGVWDLYVDGDSVPVAANFYLTGTFTEPTRIQFFGETTGDVYWDDLRLTSGNPIFTDDDNDGMSDVWENAHSLNTSVDDRSDDPDMDTLSNIEEYMGSTSPQDYYNGMPPILTKVSGDGQVGYPGIWTELPLRVNAQDGQVSDLINAPIAWAYAGGISEEKHDEAPSVELQVRTDENGESAVYAKAVDAPGDYTVTAIAYTESSQTQQSFSLHVVPLRLVYDAEDGNPDNDLVNDSNPTMDGANHVYQRAGSTTLSGNQFVPIDPDKHYRLSGLFRSVGDENSVLYFGFSCYYKKEEGGYAHIHPEYVNRKGVPAEIESYDEIAGTLHLNIAPLGWGSTGTHFRWLGYYIGGDTSKFPDIVQRGISDHETYDNVTGNILTYAAGVTPPQEVLDALAASVPVVVQNHYSGYTHNYVASTGPVPREWTEFSAENITDMSWGAGPEDEFRFGTQYIRIVAMVNYQQTSGAVIQVDDLVWEEVTDYDNDGIPDWWERRIMAADTGDSIASLEDVGATSDFDADGLTDDLEYANGSDPLLADYVSGASHVYYVNNMRGSDTACNGLSATKDLPAAGDGPFRSLSQGLSAAPTTSTIVVYETRNDYEETTLSLSGKDLTLRPSGHVILK
ncbi:hypothetical protein H5P28_17830 [Ruficoccus amylovorans]|uniref:Uncharacterized protein n=1 Tax=Ruficoccus amylovorans TaxID=1804625 RepID=A0A842HI93_9BACT|nr:hypothetical protein [Ruficoccus amylovorans]MBC2596132.1 hypothetical protein [Ruficoccus amylovorans]